MNSTGKWILRSGALLVVLAFILPSVTVSCSTMPGFGQTFTLAQISSEAQQPLLYLVPIGALVVVVLSFVGAISHSNNNLTFYAQVGCMAAGLLSMGISYFSISNQMQQTGGFKMSPEYGLFILLGGYVCSAVGFWFEWGELQQSGYLPEAVSKQPYSPPGEKIPIVQDQYASPYPYLDPIQGNIIPPEPVFLQGDIFHIGRSVDNDLQLQDPKVSRQHARFRHAQGAWFIQDQGSSHGTYVNDQVIQAQRLVSGDKISIGETLFIFHTS
ncbi:FHA domain-containing protein [Chloroflexota bacterium]